MRNVRRIYQANSQHWVGDGFLVQPLFSHMGENKQTDPFLMLDYAAPSVFEPNSSSRQRGVGQHPHKGFETVTIAYHGEVAHRDSTGGGGVIAEGDVQWMTAGSGIIHEEFHSEAFSQRGGLFEMVQLWVNLPAADKMTTPRYQAIESQNIPKIEFENQAGHLRIIAGQYAEQSGPASTFSPVNVWDGQLKAAQTQVLHVPVDHNTLLVVLVGEVQVNGSQLVQDHSVVLFAQDGEALIQLEALQDTHFLVLTGKPLNEPIQGYGPFVMNTKQEIIQAFEDFNQGKFGAIPVQHQAG